MEIVVAEPGTDPCIVTVAGRMDAITAPDVERRLSELVDEGARRVVIDLARLDYISSAGLRGFLVVAKKLKASGGQLHIAGTMGVVQQVFALSGFNAIIPVFQTVKEAQAALSAHEKAMDEKQS